MELAFLVKKIARRYFTKDMPGNSRLVSRRSFIRGAVDLTLKTAVAAGTLSLVNMQENIKRGLFPRIEIDPTIRLQEFLGLGAAMTDSSAYNIHNSPHKNEIMRDLFDPEKGIGLSLLRLPVGASDFIAHDQMYSYDDLPPGNTDRELQHFSIAHDKAYILPLLRHAVKINPNLKFIASPWSPPDWMKSNHSLFGTYKQKVGTLLPEYYATYADYLVKFIQAYQYEGINVYALTIQNEPLSPVDTYPGMALKAEDEARFIKDYLSPALKNAHLSTSIYAYDQNWDDPAYPEYILKSSASDSVGGIAWHCYSGNPSTMTNLHNKFPTSTQIITECSQGHNPLGIKKLLFASIENWVSGVIVWNLVLDESGGPKMGNGCDNCTGLITVMKDGYSRTGDFDELAKFSKNIKPGAQRIQSVTRGNVESLAFQNTDGSCVLVVFNPSNFPIPFSVDFQGQSSWYIAQTNDMSIYYLINASAFGRPFRNPATRLVSKR